MRRSAALAAVRFAQPPTQTGNLRALSFTALAHGSGYGGGGDGGGASRRAPASTPSTAVQRLLPGAPSRTAASQSKKGQVAGVDPSEMTDERTKKDGETQQRRSLQQHFFWKTAVIHMSSAPTQAGEEQLCVRQIRVVSPHGRPARPACPT